MKSQIISVNNKGFLLSEVMLAFSLMVLLVSSILVLSASMDGLRGRGEQILENLDGAFEDIASTTLTKKLYGNDTDEFFLDPLTRLASDYEVGWGRETCDPRLKFNLEKNKLYTPSISFGAGNVSTDIEARNGIAYMTTDSTAASAPDIYIVNFTNTGSPFTISSLNTGPGLSALEVAGPYIYAANLSTTNQLQIIDIHDRLSPLVVSRYKLPLPDASTTAPFATSIFYNMGIIYLGTAKWSGKEFSVIDVSDPSSPKYLGGFETGTLINSIYVRDGIAYVAGSDMQQMRMLDVHDPASISLISSFTPSGWETQQGKVISYFEGVASLGRTVGGFDVATNHEVFIFGTSTVISKNIPGGVYGVIRRPPFIYLATHSLGREFQVWKEDMTSLVYEKSLGFSPVALSCDQSDFYFATGNEKGIAILKQDNI